MPPKSGHTVWLARSLPFYYGWVVVAVAFITMSIGVNARTAFSLLFPPILGEFGWDRSVVAAAFSIGFAVSMFYAPVVGFLMDRFGPGTVVPLSAVLVSGGLFLSTTVESVWHLYVSLGILVVGGSIGMTYIGHGTFVPNWFVKKRGLAIGITFSGVGVGSLLIFPWLQSLIDVVDWRQACRSMAWLVLIVIVPLNALLQRRRPQDLGLAPDGDASGPRMEGGVDVHIVDRRWAETDWTLALALRTARFWWLFAGSVFALFSWYAVQVHQTVYLIDTGFASAEAAFALGLVPLLGVAGQIGVGYFSDRVGREWGWTIGCLGFVACYALLLLLKQQPSAAVMYTMVFVQGLFGYGLSVGISAICADLFQGRHFGRIFGAMNVASALGPAAGPWVTGLLYDATGNYVLAFIVCACCSLLAIVCIWMSAPRRVRLVAGRAPRPPRP